MDGPLAREIATKLDGSVKRADISRLRSFVRPFFHVPLTPNDSGGDIYRLRTSWDSVCGDTIGPKRVTKKRSALDYLDLYDVTFWRSPEGIEIRKVRGYSGGWRVVPSKIMGSRANPRYLCYLGDPRDHRSSD